MCLIVVKKANQKLSPAFINSVYGRNSDGWGIMWYNRKGQPSVVKGLDLFGFNKWYDKLKHKEMIIHFRMRTDGKINLANAHPYEVVPGMHMMHNGVLRGYTTGRDSDISDSANFVLKEVRPLIEKEGIEYANTPEFLTKMQKFTSHINKLAFITPGGFIVVEPNFWSRTLSGLLVSNTYAYDVDNSSYFNGYGQQKNTHSFKPGAGNFGKATILPPVKTQIPSATEHTRSKLPPLESEVRNEPEANFCATEDYDDWEGYGYSGYTGHTPSYSHNRHDYSSTPPKAALVVDNEKKNGTLLNADGEPIFGAKSKGTHALTDAEFAEMEKESYGSNDTIDDLVAKGFMY